MSKIYKRIAFLLIMIMLVHEVTQPNLLPNHTQKVKAKTTQIENTAYDKKAPTAPTDLNATEYNVNNSSQAVSRADMELPSAPGNIFIISVTDTTTTFRWLPSTDNVGVIGYEVTIGSEIVGFVKDTSYTATNLTPDSYYPIAIRAKDEVGNMSPLSKVCIVKTDMQEVKKESNDQDITLPQADLSPTVVSGSAIDPIWSSVTKDLQAPYDIVNNTSELSNSIEIVINELPLLAPTNLKATTVTGSAIILSWDDSAQNTAKVGYIIYRDGVEIGTTISNTFDDKTAIMGTVYTYIIKAYDATGNLSDPSNSVEAVINALLLLAPTNLKITTVTGSAITLSWDDSTENTAKVGYIIYRDGVEIGTSSLTSFADETAIIGTVYTYTVKAYDATGVLSDPSNMVNASLNDTLAPTAPENLTCNSVSGSSIELIWDPSYDNVAVVSYEIYQDSELIGTTDAQITKFTAKGLTAGTSYYFNVRARDEAGNLSEHSNTVMVRTMSNAPELLNVTQDARGVIITWNEVPGAEGYELCINGETILVGNVTSYIHAEILNNYIYRYEIRSIMGVNKSTWSNSMEILTERVYEDWIISEETQLEEDMEVGNLIVSNTLSLNGHRIIVHGDVTISSSVTFDGGSLICKGSFNLDHGFPVYMTNSEDYLLIEGDFFMNGSYDCYVWSVGYWFFDSAEYKYLIPTLTDGTIEFKGNFTLDKSGLFLSANNHKMIFSGDEAQSIDIKGLLCHFANVEYRNTSEVGISANKYPTADHVTDNGCSINLTTEYQGWTLNENQVIEGDVYLNGGELDLNGYTLTVNGDFIHSAGVLNVDGGYLDIQGDYCMAVLQASDIEVVCVEGSGSLIMVNPDDYIRIAGSYMMDTNQWNKDTLTEGTIEVRSDIGRAAEFVETVFESDNNHTFFLNSKVSNQGNCYIGSYHDREEDDTLIINSFANLIGNSVFTYDKTQVTGSVKVVTIYGGIYFKDHVILLSDLCVWSESRLINRTNVCIDNASLDLGKFTMLVYSDIIGAGNIDINEGNLTIHGRYGEVHIYVISQKININRGQLVVYYYGNPLFITGTIDINQGHFEAYNDVFVFGDLKLNQGKFTCSGDLIFLKNMHFSKTKGTYAPTGNYSNQFTDLQVKCLEDTIDFIRSYNSQDSDENSVFGKGWSFNYESYITDFSDTTKIVKLPDGSKESYSANYGTTYHAGNSRNNLKKLEDGSYILTTKDQIKYGYNTAGLLIWIESKEGNRLTIQIGSNDKPQSITDYVGRTYSFTYENNLLKTITDPMQRTITYEYSNNRLVKVIDRQGIETNYGYDEEGYLSSISDNNNNPVETIVYKTEGGLTKVDYVIDIYGKKKTYTYIEAEKKTIITDNMGRSTAQWYDPIYNITYSSDAEGKAVEVTYFTDNNSSKYGEIKTITDRNGNITTYERDGRGNLIK